MVRAVAVVILVASTARAAPCDPQALVARKGTWTSGGHAGLHYEKEKGVTPAIAEGVYRQLDEVAKLVEKANPEARGIAPVVSYESPAQASYTIGGPLPYTANVDHHEWICTLDGAQVAKETRNRVRIDANSLAAVATRLPEGWTIDGRRKTFFLLAEQIGEWKGKPTYRGEAGRVTVVHRETALPWVHVTRREWLLALRTVMETERKLRGSDAEYRDVFATIEKLLAGPPGGLEGPAYLASRADTTAAFRKFAEGERGFAVITFNTKYFDTRLPRHLPQFFTVTFAHDEKPEAGAKLYRDGFEARFPLDELEGLVR